MARAALPPPQVPVIDQRGMVNPDWYRYFVSIGVNASGALSASANGLLAVTDFTLAATASRTLAAGTGLSVSNGSGVAGNPSYSLADTAVTPASYGDGTHVAALTVDQQGRLTAASSVAINVPSALGYTPQNAALSRFSAFLSSDQSNVTGDGTVYTSISDTEIFDDLSEYNNATGIFTAGVTGKYHFSAWVCLGGMGAAHTIAQLDIVTTARTYRAESNPFAGANAANRFSAFVECFADMTATDTAKVQIEVAGGTLTVGTIHSGAGLTRFQGRRV